MADSTRSVFDVSAPVPHNDGQKRFLTGKKLHSWVFGSYFSTTSMGDCWLPKPPITSRTSFAPAAERKTKATSAPVQPWEQSPAGSTRHSTAVQPGSEQATRGHVVRVLLAAAVLNCYKKEGRMQKMVLRSKAHNFHLGNGVYL